MQQAHTRNIKLVARLYNSQQNAALKMSRTRVHEQNVVRMRNLRETITQSTICYKLRTITRILITMYIRNKRKSFSTLCNVG